MGLHRLIGCDSECAHIPYLEAELPNIAKYSHSESELI